LTTNLASYSFFYPLHHLVITFDLPNPVAAHYNKIYAVGLDPGDVWVGSDHLLLRLHSYLFILQISQRPREVQPSVDSSEIDRAPGFGNTLQFHLVFGFVVFAEFEGGFAVDEGDGSGVTCVGAVGPFRGDEHYVCGAAGVGLLLVFGSIVLLFHLFLDGDYLFFSGL